MIRSINSPMRQQPSDIPPPPNGGGAGVVQSPTAPAQSSLPQPAQTNFNAHQFTEIDNAVASSFAGIGGGDTVAGFGAKFSDSLRTYGDFTDAQVASLVTGFDATDPHGSSFREQGSNAAPFISAWDTNLHNIFGLSVDNSSPTSPATTIPAPPPPMITPPPSDTRGITQGLPAAQAPVPVLDTAAPAGTAAPAVVDASTTPASPTQVTQPGTTATLPQDIGSAIASALGGSSAGLTSPAMSVGVPSTAGLQSIVPTAAPTTTSSNPAIVIVVVLGVIAIGVFAFMKLHKKKGAHAPPAAA